MRAPAIALSAVVHVALVTLLVLAGGGARMPGAVDIELVPRMTIELVPAVATPSVRPREEGSAPRAAAPAPPRRPVAVRSVARPSPRAAPAARAEATEVAAPAALPDEPASGEPGPSNDQAEAEGAGGGAGGSGGGSGGSGDGGVVDRSTRAIPIDGTAPRTLPYTAEAARDRVSGDVQLVLTVDPLGRVGRVTVRRGLGHGLDEIATRLAMQIRFRPATDRSGNPTVATVRWRFHFEAP